MCTRLARPSICKVTFFKLDAELFRNQLTGRPNRDIFEHGLAAITEAWCLDGSDHQAAAQLIDDKPGQRLTLNVFGDDDQRLPALHDCLENQQKSLQRR